jgi:hypothetical protein
VAAYTSTDPSPNTSDAGVTRCPRTCSGDMKAGEPITGPVEVRRPSATVSSARTIPKSMTRGPSTVSRMFDGLRSRCTRPAPWMARNARAGRPARECSVASGNGP